MATAARADRRGCSNSRLLRQSECTQRVLQDLQDRKGVRRHVHLEERHLPQGRWMRVQRMTRHPTKEERRLAEELLQRIRTTDYAIYKPDEIKTVRSRFFNRTIDGNGRLAD